MTHPRPKTLRTFAFILATAAAAAPLRAEEKDRTIESAAVLLSRSMHEVKDLSLAQSRDAGSVLTALRSTGDKGLVPLFLRMAQSKNLENQIYGMVTAAILSKDPAKNEHPKIDLDLLFKTKDSSLIGSAIASLIDSETISDAQLQQIAADAPEAIHKVMALGELSRRKALTDRAPLVAMLKNPLDVVRYYAAITLLEKKDSPEVPAALATLHEMSDKNDLAQASVQAMMVVRVQKEKITAAEPWLVQIASDEKNDEGLRYTTVAALLTLKNPDGPRILADMIQNQKETLQQIKLGLISVDFAAQLKPETLSPLLKSRSSLAKTIADLAQKTADGTTGDHTADLVNLIKEGQPIVLDWALASCERAEPDRKMAIRAAIISQANIVDDTRGRDYERAAIAAQRIFEDGGEPGRKLLASLLKSDNLAVSEAVLAGIYRAAEPKPGESPKSQLVLPIWETVSRAVNQENAANYAALILAKEGNMQSLAWLSGMVMGGTVQNQGFRAMAGWYYAKLLGQTDVLLKRALAE